MKNRACDHLRVNPVPPKLRDHAELLPYLWPTPALAGKHLDGVIQWDALDPAWERVTH